MNMNKIKAVVLLGVSLLVVAGATVLVLTNMSGEPWKVFVFWKDVAVRRGTVLLLAGVCGWLTWLLLRTCLPIGMRALRAAKQQDKAISQGKRLEELEARQAPQGPSRPGT